MIEQLILHLAKALVDDVDAVSVRKKMRGDTHIYILHVASGDLGKVIGKHGRVAQSIRTVVTSAALKANERIVLDIES